jgi:hypothetical protein
LFAGKPPTEVPPHKFTRLSKSHNYPPPDLRSSIINLIIVYIPPLLAHLVSLGGHLLSFILHTRPPMMSDASGPSSTPNGTSNGWSNELKSYQFPTQVLTTKLGEKDRGRTPLVLCACGSFSPITYCMFKSLLKPPILAETETYRRMLTETSTPPHVRGPYTISPQRLPTMMI